MTDMTAASDLFFVFEVISHTFAFPNTTVKISSMKKPVSKKILHIVVEMLALSDEGTKIRLTGSFNFFFELQPLHNDVNPSMLWPAHDLHCITITFVI